MADGADPTLVGRDEYLLRFVCKDHYHADAPEGQRVRLGNLQTSEFKPPDKTQPSVYIEAKCSLADLEGVNPKWAIQGVLRMKVGDLLDLGLGVSVRFTPDQCQFEGVRNAHASIFGVTKSNRMQIIDFFGVSVQRPPSS